MAGDALMGPAALSRPARSPVLRWLADALWTCLSLLALAAATGGCARVIRYYHP